MKTLRNENNSFTSLDWISQDYTILEIISEDS